MKKVFLAWKSSCTRSHNQAKHFGAQEIYVWPFAGRKSVLTLLARYVVSFYLTLKILYRERPDVIFTLNQPPFLILAIFLYTRLFGGAYILDSHSAAFNDRKWAWFRPMYRFIAARALLNINTNTYHQKLVESWGGRSCIVSDVPIDHDRAYAPIEVEGRSVAVVLSFMFDEPVQAIWDAARLTPDVHFYVTGNYQKADPELLRNTPQNIHLLGYVSTDEYFRMLVSVKGIMVLTTRDHTMQMGAYEAMSLEQPIITSDWDILRESFGPGAVYVNNSASSISQGVLQLMGEHAKFLEAIKNQRQVRREYFERTRREVLELVEEVRR